MAIVFVHVHIPVEKIGTWIHDRESLALQEIEMSRVPCVAFYQKIADDTITVESIY